MKTLSFITRLFVASFLFAAFMAEVMYLSPVFAQSTICDKAERQRREKEVSKDESMCVKSCRQTAPDSPNCMKACTWMDNDSEKQLRKDAKQEDCLRKF